MAWDLLASSHGLSDTTLLIFIPLAGVVGLGFAVFQWLAVAKIKVGPAKGAEQALLEDGTADTVNTQVAEIQNAISEGMPAKSLVRCWLLLERVSDAATASLLV